MTMSMFNDTAAQYGHRDAKQGNKPRPSVHYNDEQRKMYIEAYQRYFYDLANSLSILVNVYGLNALGCGQAAQSLRGIASRAHLPTATELNDDQREAEERQRFPEYYKSY